VSLLDFTALAQVSYRSCRGLGQKEQRGWGWWNQILRASGSLLVRVRTREDCDRHIENDQINVRNVLNIVRDMLEFLGIVRLFGVPPGPLDSDLERGAHQD
jgi:hypothetical protein